MHSLTKTRAPIWCLAIFLLASAAAGLAETTRHYYIAR